MTTTQDAIPLGQIELVIFDFDGVIADSETLSLSTLRDALSLHGVEMSAEEVMRDFLGRSLHAIKAAVAERATAPDTLGETWQRELFAAFRRSLEPIASLPGLLDHLDRHAIPYCVASSSSHERLAVALEAMCLTERLPHLFSAEDVSRGKPFPDLFLHAAKAMGVAPARCLVIEDSPYGVEAAKRSEMYCAGFIGGSHLAGMEAQHEALLRARGAEIVVASHDALIAGGLGGG